MKSNKDQGSILRALVVLFYLIYVFVAFASAIEIARLASLAPPLSGYLTLLSITSVIGAICAFLISFWVYADGAEINELKKHIREREIKKKQLTEEKEETRELTCGTCAFFKTSKCPTLEKNADSEICDEYILQLESRA